MTDAPPVSPAPADERTPVWESDGVRLYFKLLAGLPWPSRWLLHIFHRRRVVDLTIEWCRARFLRDEHRWNAVANTVKPPDGWTQAREVVDD